MKNILSSIVWLVIAAPAIYLAITWNQIPSTIAMHFDLQGNADRYGSKKELIVLSLFLVGLNLLVYFLLTNAHRFDPRKQAAANKDRMHRIAFAVAVFMSALLFLIIISSSRGSIQFSIGIIFAAVGLLLAVMGNYMPGMKPNYFAGMRLPWTLESPENWRKTHLLAGRLWFGGGLLIAVICLFAPPILSIIAFSLIMVTITIIPCVYSYRYYKTHRSVNQ